jgi:hypothetical protein
MALPAKLYHGTSARHVEAILRDGIKPRGRKKSVDKNWPSHPKRIYLSDAFAFKFAVDAMTNKEGVVVFEIDTEMLLPWLLAADDDVVAEKLAKVDGMDFRAAAKKAAKVAHEYSVEHSLELGGSCSYEGPITPSLITRYVTVDYEKQQHFLWGAWDVGTGSFAYRYTKPRHAARLAWAFGDPEPDIGGLGNMRFDPATKDWAPAPWSTTRDGIAVHDLRKERAHANQGKAEAQAG